MSDYPTPKINMVASFLRLKGWDLKDEMEKYFVFSPPSEFQFEREFTFRIPKFETAVDYKEYVTQIVFSLAEMYDINKYLLLEELSKSKMEIQKEIENQQKDIEFKQRLLANAS